MADHPVITSFRLNTASARDYAAHHSFDPAELPIGTRFPQLIMEEMGYNPGSHLANKQECNVCGKAGSECIGHPLVMRLDSLGATFLSEFGLSTISSLTAVICTKCKTVVRDKMQIAKTLDELKLLPVTRFSCQCAESSPQLNRVREEKVEEKEKQYEWRDGRKHEKKRPRLVITSSIPQVKRLIEEVDLSPLRINKEHVLNLFYKDMILLPTSVMPINFSRSNATGIIEMPKMVVRYADIARSVIRGDGEEVEVAHRSLTVGKHNDRFTGTPSHIMVCDGKKGLPRGPGLNKRSMGTARAVATANVHGRCSEIRAPEFIMRNLQHSYKVSVHNKEWLQRGVGDTVTHLVIPIESSSTNGRVIYKKLGKSTMLRLGDTVLKHLTDGDYTVLFRNPTLWQHSLIGYQVKKSEGNCIELHETAAAGHNADFDGDELNLMQGTDLASRIETQMMDAAYKLFSGRSGDPIIGIAYNGIVGAYVLSGDNALDQPTFEMLRAIITGERIHESSSRIRELVIDQTYYKELASTHKIPYHSGRTLISMLLPRQLNYRRDDVVIRNGFMIEGRLKSADVSKGLITAISHIDKWRLPYLFVDRGYAMFSAYISTKGLTISASDYVMRPEIRSQIIPSDYEEALSRVEKEVIELEASKQQKTKASIQRIEEVIDHKLNVLSDSIKTLLKKGGYERTNGAVISYMSGARGNVGNIAATVSSVGQIYEGANRYDPNRSRSSYYVPRDSLNIFDRGFVRNSYAEGMDPAEVMKAANAARRQAYNTYMGVPISGNTAKQTTRHQADIHVSNSLAVVEGNERVLDCIYGYGCSSVMIGRQRTPLGDIELPIDPLALLDLVNSN